MNRLLTLLKFFSALLVLLAVSLGPVSGQTIYQPYSYDFYQKLYSVTYTSGGDLHTALKPYLISDLSPVRPIYDSLIQSHADTNGRSWLYKILFARHMVETKTKNYTFYLDYLPDIQLGREFSAKRVTYLNTRGYQLSATIGSNFFFYSSGYENQGSFANYENAYINKTGIVPGQAYGRNTSYSTSYDWAYVTTLMGYRVSNALTIVLGEDKTFIGDGYRSMLLSDFASNYPLLRVTLNLNKKVQYMAMWAYMQDQNAPKLDTLEDFRNNRRKWAVFHYLDWNVNQRFSVGFFNGLITGEANDQGQYRGFNANFINPLLFLPLSGTADKLKDHVLFGLNSHYRPLRQTVLYGQLLFDTDPASTTNGLRTAWQMGLKGWNLFKINGFNYLFEYNTASPFTYSSQNQIANYTGLGEPLAHPFGANFKEWMGIANYSIGKFDLRLQVNYAKYGLNIGNINYGKDITQFDKTVNYTGAASTGQGLATTLKYAECTLSYLINPAYNLRFEIGGLFRQENNSQSDIRANLLTVGLRSSFRNLYHDF